MVVTLLLGIPASLGSALSCPTNGVLRTKKADSTTTLQEISRRSAAAARRRGSETSASWKKKTPAAQRKYDRKRALNPDEGTVEEGEAFVHKEDQRNKKAREEDEKEEPRKPTRVMGRTRSMFAQNLTMLVLWMEDRYLRPGPRLQKLHHAMLCGMQTIRSHDHHHLPQRRPSTNHGV